jgi:hypothetical protein
VRVGSNKGELARSTRLSIRGVGSVAPNRNITKKESAPPATSPSHRAASTRCAGPSRSSRHRAAAAFRTILEYSPYENVRAQDYPAILALAGLTDPRVLYWEPAKWIARLRLMRTDRKLIAFRTNLEAGHAGAAGRFDRLQEVALAYAFALKVAGASLDAGPV